MFEGATNRIFYSGNEIKYACVNMPLNCLTYIGFGSC